MKYLTTVNGQKFEIEIKQGEIYVNGTLRNVDFQWISDTLFSAIIENHSNEALVEATDSCYEVLLKGDLYEVEVLDERQQRLMTTSSGFAESQGEISVRSPMPGLIVAVKVQEGQIISRGDAIVVLESMKMENEIKAPKGGTVDRIHVAKGDSVQQNKVLLTLH